MELYVTDFMFCSKTGISFSTNVFLKSSLSNQFVFLVLKSRTNFFSCGINDPVLQFFHSKICSSAFHSFKRRSMKIREHSNENSHFPKLQLILSCSVLTRSSQNYLNLKPCPFGFSPMEKKISLSLVILLIVTSTFSSDTPKA